MLDERAPDTEPDERVLLTVIYDSGLDERLMELLVAHGLDGWTRIAGARGCGGTGYKLDSPIWPGTNDLLLLAVTRQQAMTLAGALRALQATYRRKPGITMWLQNVTLL